jgi:hypothetical protein
MACKHRTLHSSLSLSGCITQLNGKGKGRLWENVDGVGVLTECCGTDVQKMMEKEGMPMEMPM